MGLWLPTPFRDSTDPLLFSGRSTARLSPVPDMQAWYPQPAIINDRKLKGKGLMVQFRSRGGSVVEAFEFDETRLG